jgi:calcium-translocating P-type ATPase
LEPILSAATEGTAKARAAQVEVLHSGRGRLRVHLPGWRRATWYQAEVRLRPLPGVRDFEGNSLTGNALVVFDPRATNHQTLLAAFGALCPDPATTPAALPPPVTTRAEPAPPALTPSPSTGQHARIAVPSLDRHPGLARRILHHLKTKHGIRALARPLTGHLLVEYDPHRIHLTDLVAELAGLGLPDLPVEDRPAHPLDREPLAQGLGRALGSLVGLAVITIRRLAVPVAGPRSEGIASFLAGLVHLAQGFPVVRSSLRRLLGKDAADVVANGVGIVSLTLANFPLGLVVIGVESLLFLGEVTARRAAWRRYEDRLEGTASAEPGAVIRLEAGMRVPYPARVVEGTGTAVGWGGLPVPLAPGATVSAGALVAGGPFVLELREGEPFVPGPRPAPPRPTLCDTYHRVMAPLSVVYAAFAGLRTLSPLRAFEALLLLNPRTAVIALEAANLAAAARVLRAGLTVVGTRPERNVQLPDVVLLDGPRVLTTGLEIAGVLLLEKPSEAPAFLALVGAVNAAAGSPWGHAFPQAGHVQATGGTFNGLWAAATVAGVRYTLGPPEDCPPQLEAYESRHRGGYLLGLCQEDTGRSLGYVALRPRLDNGAWALVDACSRLGVALELLPAGSPIAAEVIGSRAGVAISHSRNDITAIRHRQRAGAVVAFVSDSAEAAEAFAACDLAVALAGGRGDFPARADLLAPDLRALADLLEAGALRRAAVRDGVGLSAATNGAGALLSLLPAGLGIERASMGVYLAALLAIAGCGVRLRGGLRPESTLAFLADPRPERWGRRTVAEALHAFNTTPTGLSSAEAAARRAPLTAAGGGDALLVAFRNQLRAPITSLLAGGACLTLVLGQPLNTALLSLTTSLNIAAGIWQEREIGKAAAALERLGAGTARVLRDGRAVTVPAAAVVPGDVLVLAAGDRVAADARLLSASGLEVGEAALTGESLPVAKGPDESTDLGRIVLEGSDIIVGTARAVVVAVGRHTRLGATAAALNVDRAEESPMGVRLGRILRIALPVAVAGGAVAGLAGLVYGGTPLAQLTLGVTAALSAIPEGLPLLAGVGQAGVARRLAGHRALVRRLAAIEALGRVDVACTDKTGTLTEGRLVLRLVAGAEQEAALPGPLPDDLRRLLLTAALACPRPGADAAAHPTDMAVVRGATQAGLGEEVRAPRQAEAPFDSARAFHASLVGGRLCVKGAPERLVPRCTRVRHRGIERPLDEELRVALLARGARLAEHGLRVLLVAEGPADSPLVDPQGLTAVGFVGITDPLRATVPEAMRRCQAAGIRVLMLTGDHPATARAIAREAGLLVRGRRDVVRAADLADLPFAELDRRLESVAVVARATPLDKLHIIESLRRGGHVVAMTGDGVNDAPSLRLADVGVAMGRTGTEVARQAADVVLTDDDFATLVEALVEGRGFWQNMRNALGLLLGGNAGELGLIVGTSLLGFGAPLNAPQILVVNIITDALPSLAVVLQRPLHRNLAGLAREGLSALDRGLRRDVLRRALATALPSLGAFLTMQAFGGPAQASAAAFTSVVATQLAQTLDVGRVEGTLSRSVVNAVGGSVALLVSTVMLPPLRAPLGLVAPSLLGWGVVGASAAGAVLLSRAITSVSTLPLALGRPPATASP